MPFRVRIAVTGHRQLDDDPELVRSVDEAIRGIVDAVPSSIATPCRFEAVSPLSEGADRLIAERLMTLAHASLEVSLPLPADDYERDFETQVSRSAFRSLLDRAESVGVVAASRQRPLAYEEVGDYLIDSSDVLLAVWDGEQRRGPGGTEQVVTSAIATGMWVIVVSSSHPYAMREYNAERTWSLFRDLDRFNTTLINSRSEDRTGDSPLALPSRFETPAEIRDSVHDVTRWLVPYFGPVDRLAKQAQRRLLLASRAMAILAVAAVAVIAFLTEFVHEHHRLAVIEVALMLIVLSLWATIRRSDMHERWVSLRFLSERLRSAAFLALAGAQGFPGDAPFGIHRGATDQEWVTRAFREMWRLRPELSTDPAAARPLAEFIRRVWIDEQVRYYGVHGPKHRAAHRRQLTATAALFIGTVLAASVHAIAGGEGPLSKSLVVASIVFPALGGAFSWLDALEEHRRLADRYQSVEARLAPLAVRADRISSPDGVLQLAAQTDRELRHETAGWIDVMRYREVELIL